MKTRDSNIELFRIIVMLLIVAHHYLMHSGLLNVTSNDLTSPESIYLYLFGMWGKTGINCFVLITGYFMCCSEISIRKYLKLLFQVEFYRISISILFLLFGNQPFSIRSFLISVLPFTDIVNGFVDCYVVFYFFIPFLNILIKSMSRYQHIMLIILCLFVFCLWSQFHFFRVDSNYIIWFCVIYIISAYIRKYNIDKNISYKKWGWLTLIMIFLAYASVALLLISGRQWPYLLVYDCNTILAVMISVCSFLFFKNMSLKTNKLINVVGASTFGVLLIHDCNWDMRHWLWIDVCDCVGWYSKNVFLHSIVCVVGIFSLCSMIDILRLRLIELPLFKLLFK